MIKKKPYDEEEKNKILEILYNSCFIYALKDQVTEEQLLDLKLNYPHKFISTCQIPEIIEKYKLNIVVRYIDEEQTENNKIRKIEFKKRMK
jgi:hypothetical protein